MGANESSSIQVEFGRANLFYFGGESITGTISFQNSQSKVTLDGIFLEFVGEIGFTSRETRHRRETNGHVKTEHYTQTHQIPFVTHRFPVVQPQYGQNEIILYRGQYSWPFQFAVPQYLPPSSTPSSVEYPYVRYFMRIALNKTLEKANVKQIYRLTIFPRVNIYQQPNASHPTVFSNKNRKKVYVQGALLQPGAVPGQNLAMNFNLENPKRCEIKRVQVSLIQHRTIGPNQQAETVFRMDLPDLHEFSGSEFHRTFDLQIPPTALAPTFGFAPQQCGSVTNISFNYELRIDVKSRGLFTDFKVGVPVFVGTEPTSDQTILVNNHIEIPEASAPQYEEDLPPAYESIIHNEKA